MTSRIACGMILALAATVSAAAQVNPAGPWRTLHTQHFRIHFRPAYRAAALEAANEAERSYALLSTELQPPRGIVDLTLSDDVDTPNGYTTTYPSNRITILLTPPVTDPALETYDSWERLVITHELAHAFHLDRARGIWKMLQKIFGRAPGLFPNEYQPTWVIEGIATYYETRFTTGGRAEGSEHRAIVAADVAAGEARAPWNALLFTRWPDGLAPYAYGSRFWDFVSHTGGDSVLPRFIERTAGQLIPFRVGRPLHRVWPQSSLEESWKRAVAAASGSSSGSRSRLIAGRLRIEPVPRVAPDGRVLAYIHDDGRDARQIRVIDPMSGIVIRSHRVTGQVAFDWLGDTLIIAQLDYTGRWTVRSDVWRWSPDGDWQRLTTGGRLMEPRAGGGILTALKLGSAIDSVASGPRLATAIGGVGNTTWGPAVPSPDGRWIVAPRNQDGYWSLVRWRTGSPESITVLADAPERGAISDIVWSRDGSGVLFVTDAAGFPQVHRWRADSGIARLTAEPHGAREPAPLADGRLVFASLGDRGWELRVGEPLTGSPPVTIAPPPPPFDSAPHTPVRETGYSSWPSLRPHFWLPLGLNAGVAGQFAGAAIAGTDAVGRYVYFATALVSAAPVRAQGSFYLIDQAPGDPTLDVSAANDWSLVGTDSTGHVVSTEHRDAALGATFLAQRWRSFVSVRVAAEYEGRRYVSRPDTTLASICVGCATHDRVGGSITMAFGSAVVAPLAPSLQDGGVVSLLFRHREEQASGRRLEEVRARLNLYTRLGPSIGFGYPVLALRAALGAVDGSLPDLLSVGGVSSGAVEVGFGQTLGTFRTFPVRGYPANALHGRRAATLTAEYRVPLALVGESFGHLPFGTDKVALAFFGDLGDAWAPGEPPHLDRLRSVGGELVGDMTVSYDLPLRVRLGVAQPAAAHPQVYLAFAADF